MKQPIVLRIFKAQELVGVKQFSESQVVIGRQTDDVQVTLNDERVASIHAAIEDRDGAYHICDLGSETGTFRNGQQVLDAKLESGDTIKLGDHTIEFFIGVPKPKGPPQTHATPTPPPTPSRPDVMSVASMSAPQPTPPPQIPDAPPASVTLDAAAPPVRTTPNPRPAQARARAQKPKEKKEKTFAPASKYQSYRDFVKPSKGTVVEVLLLWKERVINSYHFSGKTLVTMGSHPECDIVLPLTLSRQRKVPLLKIEAQAVVMVSTEFTGELIKGQQSSNFAELARNNRLVRDNTGYSLTLDQGEMLRVELSDQVSLIVRYTSDSPKPLAAPMFDLSASELAGLIMAVVMGGILWLYTFLYTPPKGLGDDLGDEPLRTVKIEMEKPAAPPPVAVQPEPPKPIPTPPPTKATPSPTKQDAQVAQHKAQNNDNPGRAADLAPTKVTTGPKNPGSVHKGGAVKTGPVAGAQAKSERKDIKKFGAASVFGGGGRQNEDATSYSGAGELTGMANAATGRAGSNENRAGEGLGSMKETGRGGTGTAAVGISGGDPKGRGSGMSGYGTGGLGPRTGMRVSPGGNEESFSGTIDREAIRRVIRNNLRSIQTCYERQLNRNPDLTGKATIEWVIGEQGRVMSARIKATEVGNEVAGCVRDIIRGLRFPEPPNNQEVTVSYPFQFL